MSYIKHFTGFVVFATVITFSVLVVPPPLPTIPRVPLPPNQIPTAEAFNPD